MDSQNLISLREFEVKYKNEILLIKLIKSFTNTLLGINYDFPHINKMIIGYAKMCDIMDEIKADKLSNNCVAKLLLYHNLNNTFDDMEYTIGYKFSKYNNLNNDNQYFEAQCEKRYVQCIVNNNIYCYVVKTNQFETIVVYIDDHIHILHNELKRDTNKLHTEKYVDFHNLDSDLKRMILVSITILRNKLNNKNETTKNKCEEHLKILNKIFYD